MHTEAEMRRQALETSRVAMRLEALRARAAEARAEGDLERAREIEMAIEDNHFEANGFGPPATQDGFGSGDDGLTVDLPSEIASRIRVGGNTAVAIVTIIMVDAVLLIHIDKNAVASMKPSTIRFGVTPTMRMVCRAIR